jgi:hypothetical protein
VGPVGGAAGEPFFNVNVATVVHEPVQMRLPSEGTKV